MGFQFVSSFLGLEITFSSHSIFQPKIPLHTKLNSEKFLFYIIPHAGVPITEQHFECRKYIWCKPHFSSLSKCLYSINIMKWLCTPSSCWPFGLETLELYQFFLISALEIDSATLVWSDPWENTENFLFLKILDWNRRIQNTPSTFPPTEISETISFGRQGKRFSKSLCKYWLSSPQFHMMVSALSIAIHGLNIKELFIYCIA